MRAIFLFMSDNKFVWHHFDQIARPFQDLNPLGCKSTENNASRQLFSNMCRNRKQNSPQIKCIFCEFVGRGVMFPGIASVRPHFSPFRADSLIRAGRSSCSHCVPQPKPVSLKFVPLWTTTRRSRCSGDSGPKLGLTAKKPESRCAVQLESPLLPQDSNPCQKWVRPHPGPESSLLALVSYSLCLTSSASSARKTRHFSGCSTDLGEYRSSPLQRHDSDSFIIMIEWTVDALKCQIFWFYAFDFVATTLDHMGKQKRSPKS